MSANSLARAADELLEGDFGKASPHGFARELARTLGRTALGLSALSIPVGLGMAFLHPLEQMAQSRLGAVVVRPDVSADQDWFAGGRRLLRLRGGVPAHQSP